ncbi:hypothetical protein QNI16_12505 [Cytophagaceae bacterium YF14B1]|uniref:Uncharacterized protein n=1 Tax=Xanthocytophaga flava TaxID=3048013 RepID=A0AAE3QPT3_9BACT|nr:hypothetical protein [Xanthocytophaga flavus]MDJ1481310.1 hypothetical protein [Xanthocytophaga flavus]
MKNSNIRRALKQIAMGKLTRKEATNLLTPVEYTYTIDLEKDTHTIENNHGVKEVYNDSEWESARNKYREVLDINKIVLSDGLDQALETYM